MFLCWQMTQCKTSWTTVVLKLINRSNNLFYSYAYNKLLHWYANSDKTKLGSSFQHKFPKVIK